ncbi:unnamed protein product, partial [Ectocarpus sp. 12 AP-2014]
PQGKYTLTSVTALADPEGPPTLVCSTRELSCKGTTRGSGRTDAMSRSQRHANGGGKGNADVAKYRDACPASRSDSEIVELVKKMGGDQAKIQSALEDWWQNDQGEWATATTKKKKQTAPQHHH